LSPLELDVFGPTPNSFSRSVFPLMLFPSPVPFPEVVFLISSLFPPLWRFPFPSHHPFRSRRIDPLCFEIFAHFPPPPPRSLSPVTLSAKKTGPFSPLVHRQAVLGDLLGRLVFALRPFPLWALVPFPLVGALWVPWFCVGTIQGSCRGRFPPLALTILVFVGHRVSCVLFSPRRTLPYQFARFFTH